MEVCAVNTAVEANVVQDRKKRFKISKSAWEGDSLPSFCWFKSQNENQKLGIDRIDALMEDQKKARKHPGW